MSGLSLMSGPNWPVRRYEIIVKKGGAPLGLKLHQTKSRRGVYANGFAEGPYPPPGPQACMRVGDVLVSVDGKSVEGATLPVALAAIETARRRDRLRDFITAKQDDPRKGNVVMVFERVSPRLTFRDIALDPRKVVYLLNYMLEVRCAGTGGVGGNSSSSSGGDGKKEAVIISLDEARLMFWLEVQVLFEMSAVMAPSRDDMSKVYDKFFRPGSGFYVHELTDTRQAKIRTRRSWDGDVSGLPSVGRKADPSAKTAKEVAQPQPQAAASSGSGSGGVVSTAGIDPAASSLPGVGGGEGLDASTTASAAAGDGQEGKGGGGGGGNIEAGEPPSSADPPPAPAARSSTEGGGSDVSAKHGAEAGENGTREGSGGTKPAVGARDWVSLPVEFLAADLSKIFRASQEKVEETLTAGCFYRFKTSPWKGRMVAHLSNSPDFVHVPFERIMAEQELRDVMMLHMIITQTPGWLQVWREIELTVKPRMALLQTRRSVRHRRGSALSSRSSGTIRRHSASDDWERTLSSSMSSSSSSSSSNNNNNNNINVRVSTSTPSLSRSSSFSPPSPDMRELKAAAAVAIVASAVYLWDFFLSADSHASLGVARDTNAYVTLKQLLAENVPGDKMGGPGAGDASSGDGPDTQKGRDAGDDYAVSVGKALLDMQRHVLRKICASVYPDFQASSSHEHLCAELTTGTRSPARLPPGPPDQLDFDPAPSQQQRDSIGGGAPLPPPPQGPTSAARRGTSAAVSPPRQVRAPPPLRQKMLLQQQQQQQQGGGSEVGAGDKATSASPFAFLGGGTPPSDGERKAVTAGNSHARRSSAPGVSPTGVASRGAGIGGKSGPGRVDPFPPEEDAPRVSDRAGRVQGVSGPQFEPLWRASRGWVLEKVMRRVELPPHVSRHRPPWDKACQQGRRGEKGAVGTGRSSSGTAPPDLRQHLSLPRTARRLGRRPSHSSGSLVPGEPTKEADSSAGVGGSTHAGGGGGVAGDLDVASPPDVLGSRSGFGVQETQGIEPGPTGAREDGGSGVVGEGIRGCAEWAVSFSGSLQQGITTVQTEHAVCVAPRNLGLNVPPEGLEAFYSPCLPASGEAPRACPPLGGGKSSGVGKVGRGSGSSRGHCFGPGVPPPPPRLFTFAAPGRSGAGTFYGACLSAFRPVSQWIGGEPAADVAARGTNRSSSNSPPPCLTTTAATATATTTTALDTQRPLEEEERKAQIDGIMDGASSRTETASHVDDGAATAAAVGEERAPSRLSGVGDVSGVLDGEVPTVDDRARGNMGDNKAPAEEVAIEKEDLGQLSADGGVSSTAERETDSGVVGDAVLDDATEGREATAIDAAATAQKKKEAANTTTLDKTPSMLEMLKLKKGMGIFGKSSLVGQNKVSPSPTSTAPMSSLPPSVATTEVAPESDTEELRVEVDGQGADEAPGGLEGSGGTGAAAKTKATAAAAAASPSMMDLSSRFRLGMGMFGSGKASPRVVTGSGFSPKLGTQAAAATAAAAASTTSPAAGGAPVEASPTPSSSSGGVGKFSSYARRAGNFLGSDSRGVGRSPRPPQPPPSPDVLPNGPPPPSPLVPVYLSSPPPEAEDAVLVHSKATAVAAAAGAMDVATDGASRQLSDSAASQGGGRNKHKRSLSDVPPADAASAAAAAAVVDANELASAASAASSGVGDASKGRSMSAASSGVGSSSSSSSSSSGSGSGTRRQGESADGSGGNGRQKHTFFVASGVCLLSTRPEIGAMRRALAAYWAAHGDEILARGSATEGGAAAAHAGGEGPALAARESGGGGGSNDHGRGSSDCEVAEIPSEGSGEVEDEEEQEEKKHVGAWTEMDPSTLRDVLVPFVTQERRDEKYKEGQAHRYDKERRRSAGASQDRTSAADVLTKSFSAGSLRHPGQSSGATHGQGDRAEAGETTEGGVDMSAVAHEDGSGFGLDFDPSVVFRCLSPRNLCLVMLALLCERKVVLVSSRLSLLTQAGEVFRSLLQPLSWSHVYVPLLPRKMAADLLQCPTPFILGLESVTARELELPRDAIQVHLDTDYLCVPKDFLGLAPMSVVCSRISSVFNPGVDDLDCPSSGGAGADAGGVWAAGTARIIRFLFREFISELLQGATESTFRVGQGSTATILLDEHLYKRAKASAAKTAELFYDDQRRSSGRGGTGHGLHEQQYPGPLYNRHCGLLLDQFVKTQMLSHFLSEGGSE